jgi:predicted XRE-type DNA-binding protein
MKKPTVAITTSSGNVFEDLGLPDAAEHLATAELALCICQRIKKLKLTQAQAAKLLLVDQPKVSALWRGQLSGFSTDRLIRFLIMLGHDVQVTVKERPRSAKVGHRAFRVLSSG